jgi:exodeoxyribonuclease VII large subunit
VKGPGRKVYSVSELSGRIVARLESGFPDVWVQGEIGDFTRHGSGHWYFTLKDGDSQLRAVMFRHLNRLVAFDPREGHEVLCRGRVSGYAPRSLYQLNVDYLEPAGIGALFQQFERLKQKLEAEGLFDPGRKRPLPSPLRRVAVITSPAGAALHDILRVLRDRDPAIEVLVLPSAVQGAGAAEELRRMLEWANDPRVAAPPGGKPLEAIIIGRGGGSIEDLWAFNDEALARAIAASSLPVISAVGHEVDFTIADFVADLRAATPTAAAELVAAGRGERRQRLGHERERLHAAMLRRVAEAENGLMQALYRFHDPRRRLEELTLRVDELGLRSEAAVVRRLERTAATLGLHARTLQARDPRVRHQLARACLSSLEERLRAAGRIRLERPRARLDNGAARLAALSPLGTLERGYAIARDRDGRVVREAVTAAPGDELELILFRGRLDCEVRAVKGEGEK